MAQVPPEAVEFARMLVRAFYPPEFVVLLDAVLRLNNFVPHHQLAQKLSIQPKELRQMLTRMTQARLMRNDKRNQRRVNPYDDKVRTVTTEFWYVPLANVVDAFLYRIHHISTELDARRQNELQEQKRVCQRCKAEYNLLDILAWASPDGNSFICERMGVRADRRNLPCGGEIVEHDNSSHIKHMEQLKHRLDDELRELRARALACARMDIPNHPLANADERTWREIVPETVGLRGEPVDEDGNALNRDGTSTAISAANATAAGGNGAGVSAGGNADGKGKGGDTGEVLADDGSIPEKPAWFKEVPGGDRDDEWDQEQQNMVDTKRGTAASFNADDEKAYRERYFGGAQPLPSTSTKPNSSDGASSAHTYAPSGTGAPAAVGTQASSNGGSGATAGRVEHNDGVVEDEVRVSVRGKHVRLSEVTEEMKDSMTGDEYRAYFAIANKNTAGDDDDDEFD